MPILINAYATLLTLPPLNFQHRLRSTRDRSDPELAEHLNGFIGFVMKGGRKMTQPLYHVVQHIQRTQNHISIEIGESSDQQQHFFEWALASNAILFLTDSTVRDPFGRVLVDPETGSPSANAAVPYPEDALQRKVRTESTLRARGIQVPASLPPVGSILETRFRSAQEVLGRAFALLAVAVRAESLAMNDPMSPEELQEKLPLGFQNLSPKERAFLFDPKPNEQDVTNHLWRYESLYALEWALQLLPDLPFPDQICDVPLSAKTLFEKEGNVLAEKAQLRPEAELLDALDLTLRAHWSARQAGLTQTQAPAGLIAGVLQERHAALNWLVGFQGAEWDDVDTPT